MEMARMILYDADWFPLGDQLRLRAAIAQILHRAPTACALGAGQGNSAAPTREARANESA